MGFFISTSLGMSVGIALTLLFYRRCENRFDSSRWSVLFGGLAGGLVTMLAQVALRIFGDTSWVGDGLIPVGRFGQSAFAAAGAGRALAARAAGNYAVCLAGGRGGEPALAGRWAFALLAARGPRKPPGGAGNAEDAGARASGNG